MPDASDLQLIEPLEPADRSALIPSNGHVSITTRSCVEPCELMKFFDPENLADVYRRSNWTLAQEQAILQEIALNPAELGSTRIHAIETIRKHRTEALRMSGKLAEVTSRATKRTETPDSSVVLEVARTTSQLLQQYANTTTVVNAQVPVNPDIPTQGDENAKTPT